MLTQTARPKWKTDTHVLPVADGVYLRGNERRLFLKGKNIYHLLEHLTPHLDGNVTLAEITAGLDSAREHRIVHLLEQLFAHDFLQDTSQDQLHQLSLDELATYATDITFIESFQTSSASRFERFRQTQLLLVGSGTALSSLLQASLNCGVRQISALLLSEGQSSADFPDMFDEDAPCHIPFLDPLSWENEAEVRQALQPYDAVVYIAEQPALACVRLLNRLCREESKVLIPAHILAGRVWIGPLVASDMPGCWECAWLRQRAHLASVPDHVDSNRSLTTLEAAFIANRLLFSLFHYMTQTSLQEFAGRLDILDLATGLSESHAFLPDPRCQACQHPALPTASQLLEHIQQAQQHEPLNQDLLLQNVRVCVDREVGLFAAITNDHFTQAPLAVHSVQLPDPLAPEIVHITAAHINTKSAFLRAVRHACEWYAARCMDHRRLLPLALAQLCSSPLISAEQLIEVEPAEPRSLANAWWTWSLDLHTRQTALVPAFHVFSSGQQQQRGVASGMTWEEATCQALLDWCRELTIRHAQTTQQVYPQVDLTGTSLTDEGAYLARLLTIAGRQVAIYDITGPLGIPTFATCVADRVVAYTTHCEAARALALGLMQAMQQYQSEQYQQEDYALAPVPDLPQALRGAQPAVPYYALPEAWPARLEYLLQRLQVSGLRAYAVPLDHDPALARFFPWIVRVLFSKNQVEEEEEHYA